jgi:hypothetical protein
MPHYSAGVRGAPSLEAVTLLESRYRSVCTPSNLANQSRCFDNTGSKVIRVKVCFWIGHGLRFRVPARERNFLEK